MSKYKPLLLKQQRLLIRLIADNVITYMLRHEDKLDKEGPSDLHVSNAAKFVLRDCTTRRVQRSCNQSQKIYTHTCAAVVYAELYTRNMTNRV